MNQNISTAVSLDPGVCISCIMEKVRLELPYPNEFILFPLLAWLQFVYIPFNIAQRTWTLYMCIRIANGLFQNGAYLVTSARFGWAVARIQVCRLVIKIIVITWKKMLSKFTLQIRQYFWSCIFSRLFYTSHDYEGVTRNSPELYNA